MSKVSVTWLGDDDPSVQAIEQYGHSFVKGEAVSIDAADPATAKLRANPMFSTEKDAKAVGSSEPDPVDPDKGTEIEAVRKELDMMGVKYDGRSGLETLRSKLAAEKAKG